MYQFSNISTIVGPCFPFLTDSIMELVVGLLWSPFLSPSPTSLPSPSKWAITPLFICHTSVAQLGMETWVSPNLL